MGILIPYTFLPTLPQPPFYQFVYLTQQNGIANQRHSGQEPDQTLRQQEPSTMGEESSAEGSYSDKPFRANLPLRQRAGHNSSNQTVKKNDGSIGIEDNSVGMNNKPDDGHS